MSIPTQRTLDSSSSDPITRLINESRERLISSEYSYYLADPANRFKDNVVWKRIGRGNRLVTKSSAIAFDKAQETQAAVDACANSSDDMSGITANADALLEPAVLSVIASIDLDDCWLTPCGHWKGPNKVTKSFADLKLSFRAIAPPNPNFAIIASDFLSAVNNVKFLMDGIALGGAKSNGFLTKSKSNTDALRFRHVVFEQLSENSTTADNSDTASDESDDPDSTSSDWTMKNWPVINNEAQVELNNLAATHRPVPLPAYDIKGDLIPPVNCKTALPGAIAKLTFTLNHWFIENSSTGNEGSNSFVADIQSIRVLVNPLPPKMSPKKRKTSQRDPEERSPSKRARQTPH